MNAKILEIFKSIQGEGKYAGVAQVFVRFFECNMHCSWCDTPHSIGDTTRHYKEVSLNALLEKTDELWPGCHSVSLTGGEPLLQAEFIKAFAQRLKKKKRTTYLDSNGTLPEALKEVIDVVDIIAMDLKLPSSTKEKSFWKEHEAFLKIAKRKDLFIKTVITYDTTFKDIERAVRLVKKIAPKVPFILQPNFFQMKNGAVERSVELQNFCAKFLDDVRILPQMHKFMKVR